MAEEKGRQNDGPEIGLEDDGPEEWSILCFHNEESYKADDAGVVFGSCLAQREDIEDIVRMLRHSGNFYEVQLFAVLRTEEEVEE